MRPELPVWLSAVSANIFMKKGEFQKKMSVARTTDFLSLP